MRPIILKKARNQVYMFLTELREGVSNYRTIHNLTQQVEHQYHGRFLIELIQNAHDALELPSIEQENRIEIRFDEKDSEHGSLIVANDGRPFAHSNFESISSLANSDKDPQKSIGNKGIGFRSVLEISDCPEVYSRDDANSNSFDGYCFAFRPSVLESLKGPIHQLATQNTIPCWPGTEEPLVAKWSEAQLQEFRDKVGCKEKEEKGWLDQQIKRLSPYQLPIPLRDQKSDLVKGLETQRFATVIRLPLKSEELKKRVSEQMKSLDASTLLFLEKVTALRLVDGELDRTFARTTSSLENDLTGKKVTIQTLEGEEPTADYATWSSSLSVSTAADAFKDAVAALPDRWKEIENVSVEIAVRLGAEPEAGKFSIFLPTHLPTGSAVHINAPFFGEMSRKSIDFNDAYNKQLRDTAADLVLEVVRKRLAGKGEVEAQAIVDCLAPFGPTSGNTVWVELIKDAANRAEPGLWQENLALSPLSAHNSNPWNSLNDTFLLPSVANAAVLTEETLRTHAKFKTFHSCLNSRRKQIEHLAEGAKIHPGGRINPPANRLAETLASVAKDLCKTNGNWNVFWEEVEKLMPYGQSELAKHKLLLGTDDALHNAEDCVVFFSPQQHAQNGTGAPRELGANQVPETLQQHVAFLNAAIEVRQPNSAVRRYLAKDSLVTEYRVETIFTKVLAKKNPTLPVEFTEQQGELCRDILSWALLLNPEGDSTLGQLSNLPVPCQGGWFPMKEASFGHGWNDEVGEVGLQLETYLQVLADLNDPEAHEARKRILLPPENPRWKNGGHAYFDLLKKGKIFNGLRLAQRTEGGWESTCLASRNNFNLPLNPPGISPTLWSAWTTVARNGQQPNCQGLLRYKLECPWTFPGMDKYDDLPNSAREAFSALVLKSLPSWKTGLGKICFSRDGGHKDQILIQSPLTYFLETKKWMAIPDRNGTDWSEPSKHWLVPVETLATGASHFKHLPALPATLARTIPLGTPLVEALKTLGMQVFDPEYNGPNSAFLEKLTEAVGHADSNILLGQIRHAWNHFKPNNDNKRLTRVVVRHRGRALATHEPTSASPVFVPDSDAHSGILEALDLPVLAIETADAKALTGWFQRVYQNDVQFTSKLSLEPMVGGEPWTGNQSRPIANSALAWLVSPLLILAAHGRSLLSRAFTDRVKKLGELKVDLVPSLHFAVNIEGSAARIPSEERFAMWVPEHNTLIVTEDCLNHLEELSAAVAQVLERKDLELGLRMILKEAHGVDDRTDPHKILAPLRFLLQEDHINAVLEHLNHNTEHMSRILEVFGRVLNTDYNTETIANAKSDQELATALAIVLEGHDIAPLAIDDLLKLARSHRGLFEFARNVSLQLPEPLRERATLNHWNEALRKTNEAELINPQWRLQLETSLQEAASLVNLLAAEAIRRGCGSTFEEMQQQYQNLLKKDELGKQHWEISFANAMALLADVAQGWLNDENLLRVIRDAVSVVGLRRCLTDAGIQMEPDPYECSRKNRALVEGVAREFDKLRLACWWQQNGDSPQDESASRIDEYINTCKEELSRHGFTNEWSAEDVLRLIKGVKHDDLPNFDATVANVRDVATMREVLGIDDDTLAGLEPRLKRSRAESLHKRNLVKICGEDFDSSEDNIPNLWTFLTDKMPEDALDGELVNLSKPIQLRAMPAQEGGNRVAPQRNNRQTSRQSKDLEVFIGLCGEIHVFRFLRRMYGADSVPPSAWLSENSRKMFPSNLANDGMGCDFSFTKEGITHRVEVKATTGTDPSFILGSSEIRLAMKIATSPESHNEVFSLIHVQNALSINPKPIVLPNPYSPVHAQNFRIGDANVRIRYST
jgi:hypothetical protein